MNKKLSLSVMLMLGVALTACSGGMIPPDVLLSPLTPDPLASPLVTAGPAGTPWPAGSVDSVPGDASCVSLLQFEASLGRHICVETEILATENWGNDFVMWLDQNPPTRYIIVRNTFYLGAEGACMRIMGVVQQDADGRLFIRADDPGQVEPCVR